MQIAEQECAVKWQGHTITRAIAIVSHATDTPRDVLMHGRFQRQLKELRWLVMWAAREMGYSYPQIGRRMSGRDHSTIIYGTRKAQHLRETDADFRALSDKVLDELRAGVVPPAPEPPPPPPPPPQASEPPEPTQSAIIAARIRAGDEVVRFYDVRPDEERYWRSYLVEQNKRFCAAMRAALDEEARS